jgi:hypothetical protein
MPRLFMMLIGSMPPGRNIEQHDVFFGIADHIKDLLPDLIDFWPEAKGKIHLDAWREVTKLGDYAITVVPFTTNKTGVHLFFINLGGYKMGEFEEFHYKMIVAATDKGEAINQAKKTAFYKHTGFEGANSHIDDKYGVDVDDIYAIKDILPAKAKERYSIHVTPAPSNAAEDELHLGYFKLDTVDKWAPKKDD